MHFSLSACQLVSKIDKILPLDGGMACFHTSHYSLLLESVVHFVLDLMAYHLHSGTSRHFLHLEEFFLDFRNLQLKNKVCLTQEYQIEIYLFYKNMHHLILPIVVNRFLRIIENLQAINSACFSRIL